MKSDIAKSLNDVNYWDNGPRQVGFERNQYTQQTISYIGSNLIKVLLGQRRSGKSTVLKQVITYLITSGVKRSNILYLNFERHEINYIKTNDTLIEVIKEYLLMKDPQGKVYLFLDEIQEVDNWELVINSYLANDKLDVEIFITGSNAHLLSSELSTFVTGRYIEIPIYPFSLTEYTNYKSIKVNKQSLINYIKSSGLPETFNLPEEPQKRSYIMTLKDSILMNDVVKRYNIKNPTLLALLLDFIIDNIGKLFSINAIVKKISHTGISVNAVTVGNYIKYLERTYLIHAASRFDLKGKKILEGERKYYINDLGFFNFLQSTFDTAITRKLENFVYMELLNAGFKVSVGNIYNLEIDFVATKNDKTIYLQTTYLLTDESVIAREYGNLEKLKDNWTKAVVSMDDIQFPEKNGIKHIQAWDLPDFLNSI